MSTFYGFDFSKNQLTPEVTGVPIIKPSRLNFPFSTCDVQGKNARAAHDRVIDSIDGHTLDGTLVTGFNAGDVIRTGTFGRRVTTYAVEFTEFLVWGGRMHKPLAHASHDPNPALLFTDASKFSRRTGSHSAEYSMVDPEQSFDTVVKLVLLLTGANPQEVESDVLEVISTLGT